MVHREIRILLCIYPMVQKGLFPTITWPYCYGIFSWTSAFLFNDHVAPLVFTFPGPTKLYSFNCRASRSTVLLIYIYVYIYKCNIGTALSVFMQRWAHVFIFSQFYTDSKLLNGSTKAQ